MDLTLYKIEQVVKRKEYFYLYFVNGEIRKLPYSYFVVSFPNLQLDSSKVQSTLILLNGTVGLDLDGNRNPYKIYDVNPKKLYKDSEKITDEKEIFPEL